MDGFEVCRRFKEDQETKGIPVIFISGLDEVVDKVKGFAAGGVDYITKPFQGEEMLARVKTHLTLSRLQKKVEAQNVQLEREITIRKQAQEALQHAHDGLEDRVKERTLELTTANEQLAGSEKRLEERLRFERLLSGLFARFVNIPPDRVDSEIEDGLRQILEFFQVDRCALLHTLPDKVSWQITHVAAQEGVPPVPQGTILPVSINPWAYDKLIRRREVLSVSRLDDLPAEANADRQTWIEWGIRSNLNIPIIVGEPIDHVFAINSVKNERVWPEELYPRLQLLGEIFVNAIERKQIRLELEERLRFEGLISNLSASFVNLPPDEVDSKINKGLRSVTEFFDADRCTIGLFSEDGTHLLRAFEYHAAAAEAAPESISKEQMPWYVEQLIWGKSVVINRVEDLPPEAEKERQVCLARGTKSFLSMPMVSRGVPLGSCALVSTRAERIWPEGLIKRFRLLTEVFANALQGKRADTLLQTSEEKFRQFFAHTPEFCYIVSPEGVILDVNDWALHGLGYEREDLVGKPVATIYAPESLPKMGELFVKWKETGEIRNEEMVVMTKKGEKRTILLNVGAVRDKDGTIIHSASIQTDITEHKRAEIEVNRARTQLLHVERSARMGELTASLAHELNQPLAAILSNAQAALRFLQSKEVNLDELREILQDIIQDDQRAGNIIRSLRSMMKREERERNAIILNSVLSEVIQIFHTESIFRNVHIDTEFDESLPPVLGDKVQLQQVALNLIVNAADAMSQNPPEHRRIILGTQVKKDRVRVTIRDFGPGIDQGNVDRIFQPFFSTKRTGLGMGLAVSQTIVEAHGGHIWAENHPDSGATFFIELPINESDK
jgi:PAS domain S-box-containing protein